MNCGCRRDRRDFGPEPFVANPERLAAANQDFRVALWTGEYLQMTLMSIPVCGEIGLENHEDTDQLITVQQGMATVKMGECRDRMEICKALTQGDTVFVPAGTWHNVLNAGKETLKLTSVYAPPHHPRNTVQREK